MDENKKPSILKRIRRSMIFQIFSTIFFLAILAGLGAGYAVVEKESDPSITAGKYMIAYRAQNWDEMYNLLDNTDDNILSREAFVKAMSKNSIAGTISNYELGEPQKVNDDVVYTVTYTNSKTNEKEKFDIKLIKQKRHLFEIISKWKVALPDMEE